MCKGLCTSAVKLKPCADPAAAACNLIFPGSFLPFAMGTAESCPAACAPLPPTLLHPGEQPSVWGTSARLYIEHSKCRGFLSQRLTPSLVMPRCPCQDLDTLALLLRVAFTSISHTAVPLLFGLVRLEFF